MRALLRWLALCACAFIALQLFFVLRIAAMAVLDPQSTAFERSEAWRVLTTRGALPWRQQWVPYERISDHLKRAVIASEDDGYVQHDGVDWDALEKAWQKNTRAEEQAARRAASGRAGMAPAPKVVGGSTITQQLAKNLFLSGERSYLRKAQELVITYMLESMMSKRRILEIYLNSVEWGEGLFGAQAAARHYFRVDAARLGVEPAARLAVMLPAPKRFEKQPASAYVLGRSAVIVARMPAVELP